jgi:hypothetical protein
MRKTIGPSQGTTREMVGRITFRQVPVRIYVDAKSAANPKVICYQHVRPWWFSALQPQARKNQVVVRRIRSFFAPNIQRLC